MKGGKAPHAVPWCYFKMCSGPILDIRRSAVLGWYPFPARLMRPPLSPNLLPAACAEPSRLLARLTPTTADLAPPIPQSPPQPESRPAHAHLLSVTHRFSPGVICWRHPLPLASSRWPLQAALRCRLAFFFHRLSRRRDLPPPLRSSCILDRQTPVPSFPHGHFLPRTRPDRLLLTQTRPRRAGRVIHQVD